MIIYPAIDMRGGKVVRFLKGDPEHETVFGENPLEVAQNWIDQGAEWLHMVNLDGAFDQANDNFDILKQATQLGAKVQFGGGIRSLDDIARALDAGVSRVVLGTLAAKNPDAVEQAVQKHGAEVICAALDAKDGKVTTHGWTQQTEHTPIEFGRMMAQRGVKYALYTDVQRDGSMLGVNIEETVLLARNTDLQVIASGGVSEMREIHELARSGVVQGVIIGMALYRNEISLKEALIAAKA